MSESNGLQPGTGRPHRRQCLQGKLLLERVAGNDPASSVWKTEALPLDDTRLLRYSVFKEREIGRGPGNRIPSTCSQGMDASHYTCPRKNKTGRDLD